MRWLAVSAWAAVVVGGLVAMQNYDARPGAAPAPARFWPTQTSLGRDAAKPTLLMFAHPKCPCTRASLDELNALLARCWDQISAQVLFMRPENVDASWAHTSSWRKAAALPDVDVRADVNGQEARRFGATTSGQVMVYDRTGRLVFSGGITTGRGQAGMSAGRAALESLLLRGKAIAAGAPVYGCPLLDDPSQNTRCGESTSCGASTSNGHDEGPDRHDPARQGKDESPCCRN